MSDEHNDEYDSADTTKLKMDDASSMTDRLASLRASIRASKAPSKPDPVEEAKTSVLSGKEADAATSELDDDAPTSVLDEDDAATATIPAETAMSVPDDGDSAADEADEEDDVATATMPSSSLASMLADAAEEVDAELEKEQNPDPIETPDDARNTDELHRVERSSVPPADGGLSGDISEASFAEEAPELPSVPASQTSQMQTDEVEKLREESVGDDAGDMSESGAVEGAPDEEAPDEEAPDAETAQGEAYSPEPTMVKNIADLKGVEGAALYMSPEQCRNESPSPKTDVYALGAMLFELFENKPPFNAATVDEVLIKHQDAPVPEQASEDTPEEVRDLIGRMLSKDPSDRPDTAQVIEVLQRHVAGVGLEVHGSDEVSADAEHVVAAAAVRPPVQAPVPASATASIEHPTEEEEKKGPPLAIIGIVIALLLAVVGVIALTGGDDEAPTDEPIAQADPVADEPAQIDEPAEIEEPAEVEEPAEEPSGFEFAMGDADAGMAAGEPDAGTEVAETEPVEEPVEEVQVAAQEEEPVKRRKKRSKRTKTKKKKEIRELSLDL